MAEWDSFAQYYDLLFEDRKFDIPFWVTLAKCLGSPILELGVGTGRIAIPIAQKGVKIYGIDVSKPMLKKARQKLKRQPLKVQKLVKIIESDANSFEIPGKKFNAIFATWGLMPKTEEEQKSFFRSIKGHLAKDGSLVIDIINFRKPTEDSTHYFIKEYKDFPNKGFTMVRHVYHSVDAKTNIGTFIYFLDKISRNGKNRCFVMKREEKIYTKDDLEALLTQFGFKIIKLWGNYDFSSWGFESERTIVLAKPRQKRNASFSLNLKRKLEGLFNF